MVKIRGVGINSYGMEVNADGQAHVMAVTHSAPRYINHMKQEAYTFALETTPAGANKCFSYLKNNSDQILMLTCFSLYVASNEIIECHEVISGTPAGTTVITPHNSTVSSTNEASANIYKGTDITGLSLDGRLFRLRVPANNTSNFIEIPHGIILPKNKAIAFYAVNGSALIEMNACFNFHDHL